MDNHSYRFSKSSHFINKTSPSRANDLRKTEPMVPTGEKRKIKSPAAGKGQAGYAGAKSVDGVIQRIINIIPPHNTLVECCGGSAALTWNIKKAEKNIIIEKDPVQAELLSKTFTNHVKVFSGSFYSHLYDLIESLNDTVLYFDPPYLKENRTWQADIYKEEWDTYDHIDFLKYIKDSSTHVIINHPRSPLYDQALAGWNRIEYEYMTRKGLRPDCIWYNYLTPVELHDYRHIGKDNIDRQCIRRKRHSLIRKIKELPVLQQNAFFSEVNRVFAKGKLI